MKTGRIIGCLLAAAYLLTAASLALALGPWSGRMVGVSDGDTITVMRAGRGVRVRLAEIDCPARRQPYGRAAKNFTSEQAFNKTVRVRPTTVDRYGRVVGHVILPDGRGLNEALISAGLAWQYRRYSRSRKLAALVAKAHFSRVGLWSEPNPIAPWQWRRGRRGQSPRRALRTSPTGRIIGNRRSRVYHWPGCPSYHGVSPRNRVHFTSKAQAAAAGYRAARNCR